MSSVGRNGRIEKVRRAGRRDDPDRIMIRCTINRRSTLVTATDLRQPRQMAIGNWQLASQVNALLILLVIVALERYLD